MINWDEIKEIRKNGCPRCGAQLGGRDGVHYHGLSIWCLSCSWGKNWEKDGVLEKK